MGLRRPLLRLTRLTRLTRLALLALLVAGHPGGAQSNAVSRDPQEPRDARRSRAASASTRYDPIFRKYSKRYFGIGFDWRLLKAQAMAESELNPEARSRVGARGLMQLMPTTFAGIKSQRPEFRSIDDPEWNIAAGVMHDRYLWKLWGDEIPEPERHAFMFGSYNAGEGTITRATAVARAQKLDHRQWTNIETVAPAVPRWRWRETLGYVRKIDEGYQRLRQGH